MRIPQSSGTVSRSFADQAFSEAARIKYFQRISSVSAVELSSLSPRILASREIVFCNFSF